MEYEESKVERVLAKIEKFRKENYNAILDRAEEVSRAANSVSLYDLFKPFSSIYPTKTEDQKKKEQYDATIAFAKSCGGPIPDEVMDEIEEASRNLGHMKAEDWLRPFNI